MGLHERGAGKLSHFVKLPATVWSNLMLSVRHGCACGTSISTAAAKGRSVNGCKAAELATRCQHMRMRTHTDTAAQEPVLRPANTGGGQQTAICSPASSTSHLTRPALLHPSLPLSTQHNGRCCGPSTAQLAALGRQHEAGSHSMRETPLACNARATSPSCTPGPPAVCASTRLHVRGLETSLRAWACCARARARAMRAGRRARCHSWARPSARRPAGPP